MQGNVCQAYANTGDLEITVSPTPHSSPLSQHHSQNRPSPPGFSLLFGANKAPSLLAAIKRSQTGQLRNNRNVLLALNDSVTGSRVRVRGPRWVAGFSVVSSSGRRGQGTLCGLLYKSTNPHPHFMTSAPPKVPTSYYHCTEHQDFNIGIWGCFPDRPHRSPKFSEPERFLVTPRQRGADSSRKPYFYF